MAYRSRAGATALLTRWLSRLSIYFPAERVSADGSINAGPMDLGLMCL